jgi:hypothetical protein
MTNDDNDPWFIEWQDSADDGEEFDDDEDEVLYLPSPELTELIKVHGLVKKFNSDPASQVLAMTTIGQIEIACRTLGWRWSSTISPSGLFRMDVTTSDGREISSCHCSWLACVIDPEFADPIEHAYHDAVRNRVKEG